jgi:nitrogen regulatory protein P-II 1
MYQVRSAALRKTTEKPAETRISDTGMLFAHSGQGRNRAMTKKIEAIIREDALDAVKHALQEIGIVGLNIVEIRGHGRQGGVDMSWRGTTYKLDLLPKIQVNIILSDINVDKTVEAITKAARTGKEGDGIIFIYPVEDVVRIRTGERGHDAIMYPGDIDARKKK